jgi:hypothetical protein
VAVVQSLANHDPDVDALYRLLPHTLPFDFAAHTSEGALAPAPRFGMAPYNAQVRRWVR